jgi:hypothetical protein
LHEAYVAQSVRQGGERTFFNDKPELMQPPDFDEPLDPIDSKASLAK